MATTIPARPGVDVGGEPGAALGTGGDPDRGLIASRLPDRLKRVPGWLWVSAGLVVLMAWSTYERSGYLGVQFWMDEGITTGISLHPLAQIPGVLRHDGNPPLYYMALHIWMSIFGDTETDTHSLSLVFGVLTVPVGGWAGWQLFGRRAGIMAALLFALDSWLTAYAQETRMYELMALLGLLATAGFLLGFVERRRSYLILFAGSLALMLYTHTWGTFFFAGTAISLLPTLIATDDRRGVLRDAIMSFVGAGVLYLPWVPNLLYQVANTAAPWDRAPRFGAPVQISRDLLGGDRITMTLVLPAAIGIAPAFTRARRRSRDATMAWTLIAIPVVTLGLAWVASQINPAWASRYFAPVLPSILLLIAWGCSRARVLGLLGILIALIFWINPGDFTPQYKSNMRELASEIGPQLNRGDIVLVGQPEETPLAWYYFPGGLRFANTAGGFVADPSYMNWVHALKRLTDTDPRTTLATLVDSLAPGQRLVFVRSLTEGAQNWEAPWTQMIRRRDAQWGAQLTDDVTDGTLKVVATAPQVYHEACCVANSAVLYQKVS